MALKTRFEHVGANVEVDLLGDPYRGMAQRTGDVLDADVGLSEGLGGKDVASEWNVQNQPFAAGGATG